MSETATQKTILRLNYLLNQISIKDNEKLVFEAIISEAYHIGMDSTLLERIITDVLEKLELTTNINNYINYIDDLWTDSENPNSGLTGLKVILEATIDKKTVRNTIIEIRKEVNKYAQKEAYKLEIGTNQVIVMDKTSKTIRKEYINIVKGKDVSTYDVVINAYPNEIIIHDSPVTDEIRTFSMKWVNRSSQRNFTMKDVGLKDIETDLEEGGYVLNPRILKGVLASVIQIAIDNNLAKIKTEIDNPGFYYDDKKKKLFSINYKIQEPTKEELLSAVEVLDQLGEWFNPHENKLAHGFKWGLMAPFAYARKQLGIRTEWLYLFGRSGSGKTTLGQIILYLWDKPIDGENMVGGTNADNVARLGHHVSESTFPKIINEPAGGFNKDSVVEMIKTAVDSTTARGKYKGRRYKNVPAFNPIIYTSNHFLPSDDALLTRLNVISFNHNERKGKEEKKLFEKEFQVNAPKLSKLNKLKHISMYFASELEHDMKLLSENWQDIANTLLFRLYKDLELKIPIWLKEYCQTQTVEDFDDEETELIRSFILEKINRESKGVKIYEEEHYRLKQQEMITTNETKPVNDFKELVWDIANQRLISWLIPKVTRDNVNAICLNIGFKQDLQKNACLNYELKSIAQLLEFEYKDVKLGANSKKVIFIPLDEFITFLYPEIDETIDNMKSGENKEIMVEK